MERMISLKEILDSRTDREKELNDEINKINEIIPLQNNDQARQGWVNRKTELEEELVRVKKERLSQMHRQKEEGGTGTNIPRPIPEEAEGGDKDEEFSKIFGGDLGTKDKEQKNVPAPIGGDKTDEQEATVGGDLGSDTDDQLNKGVSDSQGSKDREQTGGDYLGGTKDPVRTGEKPVNPKALTEQQGEPPQGRFNIMAQDLFGKNFVDLTGGEVKKIEEEISSTRQPEPMEQPAIEQTPNPNTPLQNVEPTKPQVLAEVPDDRPPEEWWNRCVNGVRASGGAEDPNAVCGNLWHNIKGGRENLGKHLENFKKNPGYVRGIEKLVKQDDESNQEACKPKK